MDRHAEPPRKARQLKSTFKGEKLDRYDPARVIGRDT